MLFTFLQKQDDAKKQTELIKVMIEALHISETQKELYLGALEVLDQNGINNLYTQLSSFIENEEIKGLDEIRKDNFSSIAGMKKTEAIEKQKEMNSFSFLLHNL